jgi:predicted P-loop ATPase
MREAMTDLERDFAEACTRATGHEPRRVGDEWKTLCAAHGDTTPSLDFHEENGIIVATCRSRGCAWPSICAAIDWKPKAAAPGRPIRARYVYTDADGREIVQKIRFDDARDPKCTFSKKLNGKKLPLYRLPAVLAAKTVYVAEGEKDADTLAELGLCGTSAPYGAVTGEKFSGKWPPSYTETLRRHDVVLLQDADKAGAEHVENVVCLLTGFVKSLRIVPPFPGPKGTDVSDYLAAHGREETLAFIETAEIQAIVVSSGSWRDALDRRFVTGRGFIYVPNYRNAAIYLEHDERYTGRIRFNEFSRRMMLDENPWRDADDLNVLEWLQEPTREIPSISKTAAQDAAKWVAEKHPFHPIRDYLNGLTHDGTPRIDSWLIDHAGAEDSPYVRAVSGKWLISAVARVMCPGCQVDTALILESLQGTGKSSAVAVLGGSWFSSLSAATLHGKEAPEQLAGKWLVEMSELSSMRHSEVSAIKDFISRRNDYFRVPYGHVADDHLRQCVLAGTTNDAAFLHDDTGARRFWPVSVGACDLDALATVRDQLWAEATARYQAGEAWHLSPELEAAAAEEQEDRRVSDPWEDSVDVILERAVRDTPYMVVPSVSAAEVLHGLGLPVERYTKGGLMRVAAALMRRGWTMHRPRGKDGTRSKRYFLEAVPVDPSGPTESSMVSGSESTGSTGSILIVKKTIENPTTTDVRLVKSQDMGGAPDPVDPSPEKPRQLTPPGSTSRDLAAEYEVYRAAQETGR